MVDSSRNNHFSFHVDNRPEESRNHDSAVVVEFQQLAVVDTFHELSNSRLEGALGEEAFFKHLPDG